MTRNQAPPRKGGGKNKHPDYAAMAETLDGLAQELAARAQAEGDSVLARQGERLRELAVAIRSDLAQTE